MEKATKNLILDLKKQKRESSLLFLDNIKIIKDALAQGTIKAQCILTSLDELPFDANGVKTLKVDEKTIEQLSDTKTPQKVLCVAYYTQHIVEKPSTNFLVLDGLQDPGNVGTLIRTAKACGFETVFLVDSVKKENSKLIRSSVGAVFDSKIHQVSKSEFIELAKKWDFKLVCCDMNGNNIFDVEIKDTVGVVVGNEGQGVSDEIARLCFKTVKIPMKSGFESLNAGVSGSIIMYQINKNNIKV